MNNLDTATIGRLRAAAEKAATSVIAHRQALHRIPEVGLELPRTVAYVREALAGLGLRARDCAGGLIVDIGSSGPLVALRADMDALPIQEETALSYASCHPGRMHACGHDAHTAALLGAAAALVADPPTAYRVRLLFQPGEEGVFGARFMLEAGCLEGVDAIAGGHVGNLSEELQPGQVGFMPGPMMAASDLFSGQFFGSGGHGSAPHDTLDPIPALAHFVTASALLRSRRVDQRKPAVISVCQVEAGSAFNIIPDKASFKGTVRTLDPDIRATIIEGLEKACQGAAMQFGVRSQFDWKDGYPPVVNHPEATGVVMSAASAVLRPEDVRQMTVPSMGGEDFAYYLQRVPGTLWFMNTQNPGRGIDKPNHNPGFDVDETLLSRATLLHLGAAEALGRWLAAGRARPA